MTEDAFKAESAKTNVSLTIASVAGNQRIFTLTGLAHEITGVTVVQKTKKEKKIWHRLFGEASTKEAVGHREQLHKYITSRVSQTTLSDFCNNLEELSPTEKEEAIDDQIRSMDSPEILCEEECWSDLRADTGTLFLPAKIVMEQHIQSRSKETKSSGFEEPVGDSISDQNSKPTVNLGGRSTVMELANDSKFSGEHTTIASSSLNTMGTIRKCKSADDEADDKLNGVKSKAEAWRPIYSRYVQNTPSTKMINGSLPHDCADGHNKLPDEFVVSMESTQHKQMEDLARTQAHHHEPNLRKELLNMVM